MSNNIIETDDLTFFYGKIRGIKNTSLKVKKGEVFGFLGPNGSGKTTTQRVLIDIIRPTSGRATSCQRTARVAEKNHLGYLGLIGV